MARPSTYTPELGLAICERMALGGTVREICRNQKMPAESTVRRWALVNDEFSSLYALARERQADAWFDEALRISREADSSGDPKLVPGSRLYVDTLKWAAAKLRPRAYSDKHQVEMSGPEGGPVQFEELAKDARERLTSRIASIVAAKGANELPGEPD